MIIYNILKVVNQTLKLTRRNYNGLPDMLAASLPDKFGNIAINRYLQNQGREDSLTTIEKLCYTGKRDMDALEYEPAQEFLDANENIDLDALTKLAAEILSEKENLKLKYDDTMIEQLMQCSSSVGGKPPCDLPVRLPFCILCHFSRLHKR